jgi:DMSO/TMAO reductase YedYZ molybdopterin-dependent catalytic subunit
MKKLIVLMLLAALVAVSGCVQEPGVISLPGAEVNEYEGERLSPVSAVRDVSIKGPQHIDISSYTLEVTGLVDNPKQYSYDEVLAHQKYSKVVQVNCVLGWSSRNLWEGILLKDLFDEVGVKPETNTVIFEAYDGYTTSHSLDYIVDNDIMIAYKVNNITLTPETGYPFMLVAQDKWGYKWIKWIIRIELSDDPEYRGYWESRGYSKEGSLDEPYFE